MQAYCSNFSSSDWNCGDFCYKEERQPCLLVVSVCLSVRFAKRRQHSYEYGFSTNIDPFKKRERD